MPRLWKLPPVSHTYEDIDTQALRSSMLLELVCVVGELFDSRRLSLCASGGV